MTAQKSPKSVRAPLGEFPISDKCLGATPQFEDAPAWIYNHDNPYLHGVYAPTTRELDQGKLEVIGDLPNDLRGTYYRNGANPVLSQRTDITPLTVMGWYMRFISAMTVRATLIGGLTPQHLATKPV